MKTAAMIGRRAAAAEASSPSSEASSAVPVATASIAPASEARGSLGWTSIDTKDSCTRWRVGFASYTPLCSVPATLDGLAR